MAEINDKIREEFEAWARNHLLWGDDSEEGVGFRLDMTSGYYDWESTQAAWEAWQASREALVVKMPYAHEGFMGSEFCAPEEVRAAIEAAGLKVRS